jgi:hypothetical protein
VNSSSEKVCLFTYMHTQACFTICVSRLNMHMHIYKNSKIVIKKIDLCQHTKMHMCAPPSVSLTNALINRVTLQQQ